jgi:hypothetical protein
VRARARARARARSWEGLRRSKDAAGAVAPWWKAGPAGQAGHGAYVCGLINKESNFMVDGPKQMPTGGPRAGLGVVTSQVGIIGSMGSSEIDDERASPHGPHGPLRSTVPTSPYDFLSSTAPSRASQDLALDSAMTRTRARAEDAVPVWAAQARRDWQGRGRRRRRTWARREGARRARRRHAALVFCLVPANVCRLPPAAHTLTPSICLRCLSTRPLATLPQPRAPAPPPQIALPSRPSRPRPPLPS